MYVVKRDNRKEPVSFDKITKRLEKLRRMEPVLNSVDSNLITKIIAFGVYSGVTTRELDELAAETANYKSLLHPEYETIGARILISNHHKNTYDDFVKTMNRIQFQIKLLDGNVIDIIRKNREYFNELIDYNRDYYFDFFGFRTLHKKYLIKINGETVERPQDMWLRVSIGIHQLSFEDRTDPLKNNLMLENIKETYGGLSNLKFTHATPTLFNAGTKYPQMSSCFLNSVEDSISGIYKCLSDCAQISKRAGGIGIWLHDIRAKGSVIRTTNGNSDGIVPMIKVFNETAKYVNQAGKRKGSFALYLEPTHPDIMDFLELKLNHGKEEMRARDLFYAIWMPSLFMEKVKNDEDWCLFCPDETKEPTSNKKGYITLSDVYGEEYKQMYERLEKGKKYRKKFKARVIWEKILTSQIETGTPYILNKDSCNEHSNQKNLGTIKSSNLCAEIIEYSDENEYAVCNLASIALPKIIRNGNFDFKELENITRILTRNLNKVIDINYYPVKEAKYSNMKHRPIGIGVQGLADTFQMLGYPFTSDSAKQMNKDIFETIYYSAITESIKIAQQHGPYESFQGSPTSKGLLQFDLWNEIPGTRYDWVQVKKDVMQYGLRNSLLVALMPTAGTSQILGNSESFEPYDSNIFTRNTLAGEFVVINKHLVKELTKENLWNKQVIDKIIGYSGSIQSIDEIPDKIKEIYKTVYEIDQRELVNMNRDRCPYICQSQSQNIYIDKPDMKKLHKIHMRSYKNGNKIINYYIRSKPATDPIKFTLDNELVETIREKQNIKEKDEGYECLACSG